MLRPRPAAYPAGQVALYPLSYRRMERRAGFEPATSRVADEVTDIFTTDRDEGWRGTGDAAVPLRAPVFLRREVTDIFTTALPMLSRRQFERHAGEQAISAVSDDNAASLLGKRNCAGPRATPSRGRSRCVRQRRDSNPLYHGAKYPKSSPPASVEPRDAANRNYKTKFCRGALNGAAIANPFWVRPVIGIRLIASFPPTGPARLGTRLSGASPGIRVSRSGLRRDVSNRACFGK